MNGPGWGPLSKILGEVLSNCSRNELIPSVGGVMVSIDAFQALDPGSIPGHRNLF